MLAANSADRIAVREIPFSKFRAKIFHFMRCVQQTREPLLMTRDGEALAEIHPIPLDASEKERLRAERDARDLEIINRHAGQLNAEALDVLSYESVPAAAHESPKQKRSRKRPNAASGSKLET